MVEEANPWRSPVYPPEALPHCHPQPLSPQGHRSRAGSVKPGW